MAFSLGANMEKWLPVVGYEGIYEVSNTGHVRGLRRPKNNNGGVQIIPGRMMTERKNHKGYMTVHLSKDGVQKRVSVHRIVAMAFVENPDGKEQVNHIDGNKLNNRAENLEWVTNNENMQHAIKNGLVNYAPMLRAAHSKEARAKIARSQQKMVRRSDGKIYESVKEAAKDNSVCHSAISANIHGKSKFCVGYKFEFMRASSKSPRRPATSSL